MASQLTVMGSQSNVKSRGSRTNEERAQLIVDIANRQRDPMSSLKAFHWFKADGYQFAIGCHRVTDLSLPTISWALRLTRDNMQQLYEASEWGWSERAKRQELTHRNAWYLIASTPMGEPVGFIHFRFDVDNGIEVLYCYEVQLEASVRRLGLGKYMMLVLELVAMKSHMKKVMLTVFKHNVVGWNFFTRKMRYELDETTPTSRRTTYEILSKKLYPRPPLVRRRSSALSTT